MPDHAFDVAIADIWDELPGLLGDDWVAFEAAMLSLLRRLEGTTESAAIVDEILELFSRHPEARQRLVGAVAALTAAPTRGGEQPSSLFEKRERRILVPVFYGTCRDDTGRPEAVNRYGSGRGPASYGIVWVSIPDDHRMGEIEKPPWWRVLFRKAQPDRHFVVETLDVLDVEGFVAEVTRAVGKVIPEGLVFVHGYNVAFHDGAMRAAQIAYDLGFQGVPMYYSWPSTSTTALYTHDENEVRWAESSYRAFVELCRTRLGLSKLHVVAHSMGSRLVAETLTQVSEAGDGAPLHTVVFAAPDIDADTFGDLAREFRGRAGSCTLYASSKDYALQASAAVHGYRRAGDSRDGVLIAPGVDSIHAEAVDTGLLGHSYIGDSRSILSDVYYLLRGLGPASRAFLREVTTDTGSYWVLGP